MRHLVRYTTEIESSNVTSGVNNMTYCSLVSLYNTFGAPKMLVACILTHDHCTLTEAIALADPYVYSLEENDWY